MRNEIVASKLNYIGDLHKLFHHDCQLVCSFLGVSRVSRMTIRQRQAQSQFTGGVQLVAQPVGEFQDICQISILVSNGTDRPSALAFAGLATLTHTPNPMGFLGKLLNRPANERAFVLIPVGYPAEDTLVPAIGKKTLEQVMICAPNPSATQ